jgi:hypothetical protein
MDAKSKAILQIVVNTIASLLLIAFAIFNTTNKMHWDTAIVFLSIFVNINIVRHAREARRLAER